MRKLVFCFLVGAVMVAGLTLLHRDKVRAATPLPQDPAKPAMTNDDVIKMVEAKLGDSVIVAKIKSSACKFDTGTDALIKLKQAGVSDAVLAAMAGGTVNPGSTPSPTGPPADPNDPESSHDPGIYYLSQDSSGRQMLSLQPSSYSGEKMGGFFKAGMTGGLAKVKYKVAIAGGQAALHIKETRPVFYFYFDVKSGNFGSSGGLGDVPSSPNDFALTRLEEKKDRREVVVGQMGLTGGSTGIRSQDSIPFEVQNVRPGAYKVSPKGELKAGQYCFFFGRSGQTMGLTGGKLFDFGVIPAE